ncbi:MAG TPA: hypothetical protein VIK72_18980 [Clostridiaceae bacterium]
MKFDKAVNKPSIYKLVGGNDRNKSIACNDDPTGDVDSSSLNCYSKTLSNWSIAEEIKRLSINDVVQDMVNNNDYVFHTEECPDKDNSPLIEPNKFYRRGKSSSNSQKWQCKSCKKITNVLPSRANCTSYNQTKSEGTRWIDCTSNITNYDIEHITNLFLKVNLHSINAFMQ